MEDSIIVVGDVFSQFALVSDSVVTFSQFIQAPNTKNRVSLGQGLTTDEINKLYEIKAIETQPNMASKKHTHKHKTENILVTTPEKTGDQYVSKVFMSCLSAEISDHVTGYHISGLSIVEAARQMVNVILEMNFVNDCQVGFILNSVNSEYYQYIYPLEIMIQTQIIKQREYGANIKGISKSEIIQNNKVVATCAFGFSSMDKKFIENMEKQQALEVIQKAS